MDELLELSVSLEIFKWFDSKTLWQKVSVLLARLLNKSHRCLWFLNHPIWSQLEISEWRQKVYQNGLIDRISCWALDGEDWWSKFWSEKDFKAKDWKGLNLKDWNPKSSGECSLKVACRWNIPQNIRWVHSTTIKTIVLQVNEIGPLSVRLKSISSYQMSISAGRSFWKI